MSNHKPMILLAIFVSTAIFFIFSNAKVISQETPIESKQDTLEPIVTDEPIILYAKSLVIEQWGYQEWQSFNTLIHKESSWNHKAENPDSTATGLGQFLDGTWDDVGCIKTFNANEQIRCTIKYIKQRYDTPSNALVFHIANNWY